MDTDDTMDYDKVKTAVLEKFEISTETYRSRFRSTTVKEDETPKELRTHLKDLYEEWMVPKEKTREQIGDVVVLEHFLRVLSPDLQTWVKERNPSTSKEAAEIAEAFLAARRPQKGVPAKLMPALKQEVEEMLARGIIEPSRGQPYAFTSSSTGQSDSTTISLMMGQSDATTNSSPMGQSDAITPSLMVQPSASPSPLRSQPAFSKPEPFSGKVPEPEPFSRLAPKPEPFSGPSPKPEPFSGPFPKP
ncbi:PREDICTED: zinc finger protein 24-like [Cyprinodon variegatus]|uniref:zinc finger protein 24-like n=1 Tax=Cyprinodon variegatus TaxID=28743 RepID=UPI000742B4DC|nr:PREDICTED: zinc finger protein 24-like [Cyprinodon variegatus]